MQISTLSIIVPAYNEEKTIASILDKIAETTLINDIAKEIIVVNDCSTDGTDEVVKAYMNTHPELKIAYYSHEKNQGKVRHYIRVLHKQQAII